MQKISVSKGADRACQPMPGISSLGQGHIRILGLMKELRFDQGLKRSYAFQFWRVLDMEVDR